MKRNIFKTSLLACTALFTVSCTSSFDDVNTDPDRTDEAPLTNMLTRLIRYSSNVLFDAWNDMNEPSTYGGHLSKIQYIDESRYEFRPEVVENKWYYIYLTYNNAKEIEKRAAKDGLVNMENVAKIWATQLIAISTDTWRDVPYSEAGKMDEGILLPKYDKQEDIYPMMLADLEKAADALASGAKDELGVGDVLFGGDIMKWRRFCNSLRLRLAMRISAADDSLAKSTIESILSNPDKYPVIETNEDNAFFMWPGSAPYLEPWADNSRTRDDHAISDIMVNLLKSLDDPRLPVYALPTVKDGSYVGFEIGAKDQVDLESVSRIGTRFRGDYAGFTPYFRAAETFFVIAEASKNGWNTGSTTKDAYEKAVTLSLEENGITDASTYLNGKAKFNDTKKQIQEQTWIALFKQGMEAWSHFRRTGVPETHHVAAGTPYPGHNTPPFRYPYPGNEANLNSANNAQFIGNVKDFFWGQQMWWDKRIRVN